jgi:hypothetical protein
MIKLDTSTGPNAGYRPPGSLEDSTVAFEGYAGPFSQRNAAHLLRRAGFGGTVVEVDIAASLGARGAVDALLDPPAPEVDFSASPDAAALNDPKTRNMAAQMWWLDRMLRTRRPLCEKMTLFWHGHFGTSITGVPASLMIAQIELLRSCGLGRFPGLLLAVAKDPAMLVWLEGRTNVKAHLNENFAREVLENFALGRGNYLEDDVKNAARGFTGWTLDKNLGFVFRPTQHDDGSKTFLGKSGTFTGEEIVSIIVEQPLHQQFICRKLLEFFVYADPEPELVDALAQIYARSGGDVGLTVATILRSNVFFSERAYRALPKSPLEFVIGTLRFLQIRKVPKDTLAWLGRMGQIPLAPPSVEGSHSARVNFVNRVVRAAPVPAAETSSALSTTSCAPAGDPETFAAFAPADVVRRAKGFDPDRVLDVLVRDAVQDDVTSELRRPISDCLESKSAKLPTPLGPDNYDERIRGALALVLDLPVNGLN